MDHQIFFHDWILDARRFANYWSYQSSLADACTEYDVQQLQTEFKNSEGYTVHRFILRVPSLEALENYAQVAANWGFVGWQALPDDDPIAEGLRSVTEAQWKRIAEVTAEVSSLISNSDRKAFDHIKEWQVVQENELLKKRKRKGSAFTHDDCSTVLRSLLVQARDLILLPDNDFRDSDWGILSFLREANGWLSQTTFLSQVDGYLAISDLSRESTLRELQTFFAYSGPLRGLSVWNNWFPKFLEIGNQFDLVVEALDQT